jgi:hypothetical protein
MLKAIAVLHRKGLLAEYNGKALKAVLPLNRKV